MVTMLPVLAGLAPTADDLSYTAEASSRFGRAFQATLNAESRARSVAGAPRRLDGKGAERVRAVGPNSPLQSSHYMNPRAEKYSPVLQPSPRQ